MLREFFKTLGGYGIYILAFFIPALVLFYWALVNLYAAADRNSEKSISFIVESGWTTSNIAESLEKAGLIRNPAAIEFITKYRMSEDERNNLKISAGEYALSPSMKPSEILEVLMGGKVVLHDIVIAAGSDITQVAALLGKTDVITEQEAYLAFRDSATMAQLGVPAYIPEGYLIGGTYQFTRLPNPNDIIAKLVEQGNQKLDELVPDWRSRAKRLGFQPYDILKLASLIEKETTVDTERETISSLMHNRLRIGLPLQSDVSIQYARPELQGKVISEEARRTPGPYNTYLNTGLPQTPICSPSSVSIEAALAPKNTDYLYMMAKGDGSHDFSARFVEHQKKVKKSRDAILADL